VVIRRYQRGNQKP